MPLKKTECSAILFDKDQAWFPEYLPVALPVQIYSDFHDHGNCTK